MTKLQLMNMISGYKNGYVSFEAIETAVDVYSSASNDGKPHVSGALPTDDNRVMFADYIQRCVIERGQMTYPSLKDAIKAWDETTGRFGGNDR